MKSFLKSSFDSVKTGIHRTLAKIDDNDFITEPERITKEATSNTSGGISNTLKKQIARMTLSGEDWVLRTIYQIIMHRLKANRRNWRQIQRALELLDYLIRFGHDRIAQGACDTLCCDRVRKLTDFQHKNKEGRDRGDIIRRRACALMELLTNPDALCEARREAIKLKNRKGSVWQDKGKSRSGGSRNIEALYDLEEESFDLVRDLDSQDRRFDDDTGCIHPAKDAPGFHIGYSVPSFVGTAPKSDSRMGRDGDHSLQHTFEDDGRSSVSSSKDGGQSSPRISSTGATGGSTTSRNLAPFDLQDPFDDPLLDNLPPNKYSNPFEPTDTSAVKQEPQGYTIDDVLFEVCATLPKPRSSSTSMPTAAQESQPAASSTFNPFAELETSMADRKVSEVSGADHLLSQFGAIEIAGDQEDADAGDGSTDPELRMFDIFSTLPEVPAGPMPSEEKSSREESAAAPGPVFDPFDALFDFGGQDAN